MQLQHLRHATCVLNLGGALLLIDPMLSRAEALDPAPNAANQRRFPLVKLPVDDDALERLINTLDAAIVTHTHRDHWDAQAVELLPKDLPVLCQPEDAQRISDAGFTAVLPVVEQRQWRNVRLTRTGGQHGLGEIGRKMAPVSGFVLRATGEPSIYIAGDTVWCPEVAEALRLHQPDITIVNSGAAQFLTGGPITMTAADVAQVCRALPSTRVVVMHLETVNHCLLTRAELAEELRREGLTDRVRIPADGEVIAW